MLMYVGVDLTGHPAVFDHTPYRGNYEGTLSE
jgi:hypothetical protein